MKVIVVLDAEVESDFSAKDLRENAPDFINLQLGRSATGPNSPYHFTDASVYTSLGDFELDRVEGLGPFEAKEAASWVEESEEVTV